MDDERAKSLIAELDAIAREYDHYDYGLPSSDDEMAKMVAVVNEFVRRSIPSQWSSELPAVPGWYVYCDHRGCWLAKNEGDESLTWPDSAPSGEWLGMWHGPLSQSSISILPAPQWTREPVSPGLYWCRSVANNSPATVYEIISTRRGLRVQTPEGDIDELYSNVEWLGPLPEPK